MQVIVKPISASLTRDTETFSRMVTPLLFRIHTASVLFLDKDRKLELMMRVENSQDGTIL